MAGKEWIVDPSLYDLDKPIADIEAIRKYNMQRYEMEHLTAVVYEDPETHSCVGYKDLTDEEFWVRGHMPGFPLMPGVIMCEAAAQLTSYYSQRHRVMDEGLVGFAGLESVRFRGMVKPGDRFVIQARMLKARKRMVTAEFQCYVGDTLVCEGVMKGTRLPVDAMGSGEKS